MSAEIHIGEVGTQFVVTVKDQDGAIVPLDTAVVKKIRFRRPNGTVFERAAGFVTNGADGQISYTSVAADLDTKGDWRLQGYVEVFGGKWWTDEHTFAVKALF
jgi:hypothetical protein